MSARTTSKSTRRRRQRLTTDSVAVFAHVPVDRFEIVDGPSRARSTDIEEALRIIDELGIRHDEDGYPYYDQEFTLLTSASTTKFGRTLQLATIFDHQTDGNFCFTGVFSGKVVSGWYNPNTRKGWFTLD